MHFARNIKKNQKLLNRFVTCLDINRRNRKEKTHNNKITLVRNFNG